MYRKILVPIDGSESSIRALQEALKIANMARGEITLTHVYSIGTSVVMSNRQDLFCKLAIKNGKSVLENGKKLAKAQGIEVKTLLLEGDAVEQIIRTSKEGDFNLIVMGARGLSKMTELFLGSVSHAVIKNAPCPVLVTR